MLYKPLNNNQGAVQVGTACKFQNFLADSFSEKFRFSGKNIGVNVEARQWKGGKHPLRKAFCTQMKSGEKSFRYTAPPLRRHPGHKNDGSP